MRSRENNKLTNEDEAEPKQGVKFEVICGIVIALLAAILAVNDLGAGKFGDVRLAVSAFAYNQAFAVA